MRRFVFWAIVALAVLAVGVPAWAGSPHFVDATVTCTRPGNTLTCAGKEAGLGDEAQIHIVVRATAECTTPGHQHPEAANKEPVSAPGDSPVHNGKASVSPSVTASFQPEC